MSHYYGTAQGGRGKTTRAGSKGSGIYTHTATRTSSIFVHMWWDPITKQDRVKIRLTPWLDGLNDSGGKAVIYDGTMQRLVKAASSSSLIPADDLHYDHTERAS